MLLIFPKPKELSGYIILGILLTNADEIVMNENADETYSLALLKHLADAEKSYAHTPLGTFHTADKCYKVFQEIVDALHSGKQTFKMPASEAIPQSILQNQRLN